MFVVGLWDSNLNISMLLHAVQHVNRHQADPAGRLHRAWFPCRQPGTNRISFCGVLVFVGVSRQYRSLFLAPIYVVSIPMRSR